MTHTRDVADVLANYAAGYQPAQLEFLKGGGGFSGAQFWRLSAPVGSLCLRCWPREHPPHHQLEFIHSVLRHAASHGSTILPVPIPTQEGNSIVESGRHLWELAPWLPGRADYRDAPNTNKLRAAMTALAQFHIATASYPLRDSHRGPSPGIVSRLKRLGDLVFGGPQRLAGAIDHTLARDLTPRFRRLVELFPRVQTRVHRALIKAATLIVPLQPCIRDIWHDHVLFDGDQVTGLIDFGAIRVDSVSGDIARLLGSLAGDDAEARRVGLEAYKTIRPLNKNEGRLIEVSDQANALLSGVNWLEWVCVERRQFDNMKEVDRRMEEILGRLEHLCIRESSRKQGGGQELL